MQGKTRQFVCLLCVASTLVGLYQCASSYLWLWLISSYLLGEFPAFKTRVSFQPLLLEDQAPSEARGEIQVSLQVLRIRHSRRSPLQPRDDALRRSVLQRPRVRGISGTEHILRVPRRCQPKIVSEIWISLFSNQSIVLQGLLSRDESESLLLSHQHLYSGMWSLKRNFFYSLFFGRKSLMID